MSNEGVLPSTSDGAASSVTPIVERAKDLGREVLHQAERQGRRGIHAAGAGIEAVAQRVDDGLGKAADEGEIPGLSREQVRAVSGQIEAAGRYLQGSDPRSLLVDLDDSIRKHPYRAAAVAFGVGWLIGRLARPSR